MLKILSRYEELLFWCHLVLHSFFTQSFTREFRVWNTVSGQPKLWPLYGYSISIDVDLEDVRFLLVSPLADSDLTNLSHDNLSNKNQIVTFVSAITLRTFVVPLIWLFQILDIALGLKNLHDFDIIHGDLRAVRGVPRVVIYPSHSFYFRVASSALASIVI